MADTQEAPQPAIQPIPALGGSITEAQEALLSLEEPEKEKPIEEGAAPTEEEESTEETQDESLEEESEDEAEEPDEGEEEESEETDDGEEEDPLYAVTVNGEEHEVTFDELLRGYSRQSDYTRKTQELSTERKQMEELQQQYTSEVSQIQSERQQYMENLQQIIELSAGDMESFANVDWKELNGMIATIGSLITKITVPTLSITDDNTIYPIKIDGDGTNNGIYTVNLPAPTTSGLSYKFLIVETDNEDFGMTKKIQFTSTGNNIFGFVKDNYIQNKTNIILDRISTYKGQYIEFMAIENKWNISGNTVKLTYT